MMAEKSNKWQSAVSRLLMFAMLVACLLDPLLPRAFAEQAIQLSVTAGIGGDYRESDTIPVQVTVMNGGGTDVEGNVVIATGNGSDLFSAAYYQPVSVAKGATKQVTILVPGTEIGPNSYVAVQQNGETVAKTTIGGRRYSQDSLLIGVLASDPDTANFLGTMPKNKFSEQVRVLPMKAEQVPQAAAQLGMLNMLILNDFALDSLNEKQIQAIKEWTQNGGMLILAGGATYAKSAGALAELSPVAVTGVGSVSKLSGVTVEKEQPVQLPSPLIVSMGTVKEGRLLAAEGTVPVTAVRSVGQGKVLYVAYDLAQEPVASWSGNSRYWADLLTKAFGSSLYAHMNNPANDIWALDNASDRIPALKLPEVPWLALYFGLYALLVGPVFYYVLRKKRKQSYMWGIVPAFAVVAGVGIFAYGAAQRGSGMVLHSTGYLQFTQAGQAKGIEVASAFVPRSADYEAEVKGSGRVWPIINGRGNEVEPKVWISAQNDHTTAQFRDVEFWSVRKLGMMTSIPNAGSFVSDLSYRDGKLSGTVTNRTQYPLHDVKIIAGQTIQPIEDLAAGASVKVDLSFNAQAQIAPGRRLYSSKNNLIPQAVQNNSNAEDSREWMMLDILDQGRQNALDNSNGVMLMGWSDMPINDVEMKRETVRKEHLTLVTSPLSIKPSPDGTVFYPAGTFQAIMTESTAETDELDNGYQMRAGDITFEFHLQEENQQLQVSKLYIYTWSEDKTLFDKQVYNWQTKTFVPFDQAFADNKLEGAKIGTFLSPDGVLRVKFSHSRDEYRHIGTPVVGVEGKLVKP
ncbi:UNVERIFIED_CONTAM: hypothetical protein ABID98_005503 [Brevibacillus sp. OAP136]